VSGDYDENRLDQALTGVFGTPSPPDFDRWRRERPEAVAALKSLADSQDLDPPQRSAWRGMTAGKIVRRPAMAAAVCVAAVVVGVLVWRQVDDGCGIPEPDVVELAGQAAEKSSLNEAGVPPPHATIRRPKSSSPEPPEAPTDSGQAASKTKPTEMLALAEAATKLEASPPGVSDPPARSNGQSKADAAASSTRRIPLSAQLVTAEAAVRVKMLKIDPRYLECREIRTIFGSVPRPLIRVEGMPGAVAGGDPEDRDAWPRYVQMNHFEVGREVILLVDDCREENGVTICRWRQTWIDSIQRPLDRLEEKIIEVLKEEERERP